MHDLARRLSSLPQPDLEAIAAAERRQSQLTKPQGSLGRLEALAIWLAGWQARAQPRLEQVRIAVFAGNHGIAARKVSAYPADVTAQMVANYRAGGAAINQLAASSGAELHVVPLALECPTADFTAGAALTESEFAQAWAEGESAVGEALDLLALGEMGIGNTTSAAALAAALFGGNGRDWAGHGTGVDEAGVARKAAAIDAALICHGEALAKPLEALRRLGGRELVAIAGAVLAARERRIPVVLDGFVCSVAAAVLGRLERAALDHCLAGHRSAEQAHGRLLDHLRLAPLFDLGMRLGEGSGAALAIAVLKAAVACHSGMATFAEAGVSGKH
jgi:nicotinate-nucleotide--dimethylbenzimidazole phosphoribosyltransferase